MKRIALFTILLVFLLSAFDTPAQSGGGRTLRDYQILEEKFEELDKLPGTVSVEIGKSADPLNTEASVGDYYLKVERLVGSAKSEAIWVVDLSTIRAPSEEAITGMITSVLVSPSAKCGMIPSVVIAQINASKDYEVQVDYAYDMGHCKITVPKGFIYDRASIPAIVWPIISPDSLGNVAPLLHDYLYRHGGKLPKTQVNPYRTFTREETDNLFLELMTKCEVTRWRRLAAHQAVRTFSGFAWKDSPP
jgi:hypothetical protein